MKTNHNSSPGAFGSVELMRGSRGGDNGSGPPPLKNYKNIGFLSNDGPDPSYQASIQCWVIIGPPAERHLNNVSLAGR